MVPLRRLLWVLYLLYSIDVSLAALVDAADDM